MDEEKRLKPRKKPLQDRAIETVEVILEAAAQVFSERGFAGGTTNRIAERAGVSIGSLYQYFPNKDAILLSLLEQHAQEGVILISNMLAQVQSASLEPKDALRRLIQAMVEFHMDDPKLHKVLFEEAPRPKVLMDMFRKTEESIAQTVEGLLKISPHLKVKNLNMAARIVVQTVESLSHWYVLYAPEGMERDLFIDETVDMLNSYLFSKSASGS